MGPKPGTQRGRGNTSTDKKPTASDNTTDSSISKLWTGRPYDKPAWFLLNRRDLFDAVNGARQFIRFGISVEKKVSVKSLRHAQAYLNGTIIEGRLWPGFIEIRKKILGRGHKKEILKNIQSGLKENLILAQLNGSLTFERTVVCSILIPFDHLVFHS